MLRTLGLDPEGAAAIALARVDAARETACAEHAIGDAAHLLTRTRGWMERWRA